MVERRYWDAGCFIAWLSMEEGRFDTCDSIITAADEGELEIVTSAFTITEVLFPKGGVMIPAEHRTKVRNFLRKKCFVLVQVDRTVAELAQDLVWEKGIRPKDAIHVASALRAGVYALETYDEGLVKKNGRVGGSPALQNRHPLAISGPSYDLFESDDEDV
jgi:predicted nucleic acid-binding protein